MAKPDTEDGWLMYAHELDAAVAAADFSKGARIVLREQFAQIYGPAKLRAAELIPAVIAERSGLKRQNVYRYIEDLVESNVLRRLDATHYAFVKDYEAWTRGGQPRLSPAEVRYAREAAVNAMAYKRTGHQPPATHKQKTRLQPETKVSPTGDKICLHPETNGVSIERQICLQPETDLSLSRDSAPIRNGRAEFETGKQASQLACPVTFGDHQSCVEAAMEIDDRSAAAVAANRADIAERLSGRFDCYEAAVREVARRYKRPGFKRLESFHHYVMAIAMEYAVMGIPAEPVPLAPAPAPDPSANGFKATDADIEAMRRRYAVSAAKAKGAQL